MRRDVCGETVLQGSKTYEERPSCRMLCLEMLGKRMFNDKKRGINGYARSRKEATSTRKMESCR